MRKYFMKGMIVGGVLALSLLFFIPQTQGATSSNWKCYKNNTTLISSSDEWSRYIEISIPIPGLTDKLYCYDETGGTKTLAKEYYYTESLGDYLANFYRYFVSIVGILGAVMVMYGGIRWILAAGNQQRIQGAKNVIFSAIVGIVIAFCSYLLLFLLNPRLVDYSTLQTHLVNVTAVAQSSEFCTDFQTKDNTDGNFQYYPLSGALATQLLSTPDNIECGVETAILDQSIAQNITSGGSIQPGTKVPTCRGTKCAPGFCMATPNEATEYKCMNGFIAGKIQFSGNAYIDQLKVEAVCNDGTRINGISGSFDSCLVIIPDPGKARYISSLTLSGCLINNAVESNQATAFKSLNDSCNGKGGVGGYYLNMEINDDQGAIFNLFSTVDDNFAVGRDCAPIFSYKDPEKFTKDEWLTAIQNKRLFKVEDFFNGTAVKSNPYICNFDISRNSFPAR